MYNFFLNKSASKTNLLLNHIVSTFNAKAGILWFSDTNTFKISSLYGSRKISNSQTLASFLAGFHYRFLRSGNKFSPVIIENINSSTHFPEDFVRLARIENVQCIHISPVLRNGEIKGALVLGLENSDALNAINYELLEVLTDSIKFDEKLESITNQDGVTRDSLGLIIGRSQKILELYKTILNIAESDSHVFIHGESGTGKELVARTIHEQSKRNHHVFIPIECISLPENLLESELFGHERQSSSGKKNMKIGLLEYADKGTFFLDKITEMHIDLQAKLFDALQNKQFKKIGSVKSLNIDVRIILASNFKPHKAIANRRLKEDLFERFDIVPIYIAPLRERKEDIPLLITHFIKGFSKSSNDSNIHLSDDALQYLVHYHWPGNIRELKSLIEYLATFVKNEIITLEDLPLEIVKNTSIPRVNQNLTFEKLPYYQAKVKNLMEFERLYFSTLLNACQGNITKVAKEAQVSRKTIYNILKKHSLNNLQLESRVVM